MTPGVRRPLVRLFLGRFFESEFLPPGLSQVQIVIWALVLLAAPGYMLSMIFAARYGRLRPARVPDAVLTDSLFFLTYSMMALGVVALVVWESVFPDRRDVRVLGVLPLPDRAHVAARLIALALIGVLFAAGGNLPTAVAYGLTLWVQEQAGGPVHGVAAQLLTSMAAGLFAFFVVIAGQGALLNLAGRRAAQRLGLVLQAAFVVALLQALVFVPYLGERVRDGFAAGGTGWSAWFPPAWFLALLQWLSASPRAVPAHLAVTAVLATAAAVLGAAVLLAASYRRLVRLALESEGREPGRRHAATSLSDRAIRILVRDPVARAAAAFVIRTVTRSRTHQTLLASYAGLAAALVLGGLIPVLARGGWRALHVPGVMTTSPPFVWLFVLLCGLRAILAIPAELKANLAFRIHAPETGLNAVVDGVRTVGMAGVIAPVAAAALLFGAWAWGPGPGVRHALFAAATGMVLLDALLLGLRWIPFTRPYRASSRARMAWPLYLLAFSIFTYTLAGIELVLLERPAVLLGAVAVAAALSTALARMRHHVLQSPPWLSFEAPDPDALFPGFGLSEGLAAESRRALPPAGAGE
jgi:hypothetical protein